MQETTSTRAMRTWRTILLRGTRQDLPCTSSGDPAPRVPEMSPDRAPNPRPTHGNTLVMPAACPIGGVGLSPQAGASSSAYAWLSSAVQFSCEVIMRVPAFCVDTVHPWLFSVTTIIGCQTFSCRAYLIAGPAHSAVSGFCNREENVESRMRTAGSGLPRSTMQYLSSSFSASSWLDLAMMEANRQPVSSR